MTRPLNKRELKKLARKKSEANSKKITAVFYIIIFLSLGLLVYSYIQYRLTIIDYKIVLAVFIVSGLLLSGFIKKYFDNALKESGVKMSVFGYFFPMASIATALCFFLNGLFAESEVYYIEAPIVETYKGRTRGGMKLIGAVIELPDFTKDIGFPIEDKERLYDSDFIELTVSKGGLGFEVIKDRELLKSE